MRTANLSITYLRQTVHYVNQFAHFNLWKLSFFSCWFVIAVCFVLPLVAIAKAIVRAAFC